MSTPDTETPAGDDDAEPRAIAAGEETVDAAEADEVPEPEAARATDEVPEPEAARAADEVPEPEAARAADEADVHEANVDEGPDSILGRPRRTRRRVSGKLTAAVVLLALLSTGAIPTLGVVGVRTIVDSREGRTIAAAGRAYDVVLPETPAQLAVAIDERGVPISIVLASQAPGGQGGYVVMLPVSTVVEVPGSAEETILREVYREGGTRVIGTVVEAALGISLQQVTVIDPDGWGPLLARSVTVDLADPVEVERVDGGIERLFEAGEVTVDPGDVATLLGARRPTEREAAVLVRHEAVWTGIMQAMGQNPAPVTTVPPTTVVGVAPPPPPLDAFLQAIGAGEHSVSLLPVMLQPGSGRGGQEERFLIDSVSARLLVAQAMPGAVSPAGGNPRLRLVNPTGDPWVVQAAAGRLLFVGFTIVIASDTEDDPPAVTEVRYADADLARSADIARRVLEAGRAVQGGEAIEGIDVTIVLGEDFAEVAERQRADQNQEEEDPEPTEP